MSEYLKATVNHPYPHLSVQQSSLLNRDELHVLSALLFDTMNSFHGRYQEGRKDCQEGRKDFQEGRKLFNEGRKEYYEGREEFHEGRKEIGNYFEGSNFIEKHRLFSRHHSPVSTPPSSEGDIPSDHFGTFGYWDQSKSIPVKVKTEDCLQQHSFLSTRKDSTVSENNSMDNSTLRKCQVTGCDKKSQGGVLCIKHGGGKRCNVDGCTKSVQSRGRCKAHGGGPRCQYEGCSKSSQGGGLCRAHGGGKRCLYEGCEKGTQKGDFCATHGGNRICKVEGCLRNSRGGNLCAAHGGGKRCEEFLCRRPARKQGKCSMHAAAS